MALDTHAAVKTLTDAGADEALAVAVVEVAREAHFDTALAQLECSGRSSPRRYSRRLVPLSSSSGLPVRSRPSAAAAAAALFSGATGLRVIPPPQR